jgi:hypothetical protein
MSVRDFLCTEAATPFCKHYSAAGAVCRLSTNSELLLEAAQETFLPLDSSPTSPDFSVRFWVDHGKRAGVFQAKPYVRGLDHLVFAGFDTGNSLLVDLRTRRVIGRFSGEIAANRTFWKTLVFPVLLTIISASVGVVELHCSCVAKNHNGLLLIGPGRSGKSTLAAALGQAGFGFLSDDRTFCTRQAGGLLAWGLGATIKLRSDAVAYFKQLQCKKPIDLQDGETGFRLEPESEFGLTRINRCEPQMLVFLEPSLNPGFRLIEMSSEEAAARISQDLLSELPEAADRQMKVVSRLVQRPCRILQYGGQPAEVADRLAFHFAQLNRTESGTGSST